MASKWESYMAPVSIFQVRLRSLKPGEVGGPINKSSIGFGYWFVEDILNDLCFGALQQINVQMAEIAAYQTENIWASSSATSGGVVYRGAKYAGPEGLETHRRIQRLCPSIAYIHVLTCFNHHIARFLMGNLRRRLLWYCVCIILITWPMRMLPLQSESDQLRKKDPICLSRILLAADPNLRTKLQEHHKSSVAKRPLW